MMKDFWKKLNKPQTDVEDLDTGYDSEYYRGAYDPNSRERDEGRHDDSRSNDSRSNDSRFNDRRADERDDNGLGRRESRLSDRFDEARGDRLSDRFEESRTGDRGYDRDYGYAPRGGWQEEDAPSYRERVEAQPEPVFAPAPAPEYLYFTPSTYRDCREGIVKGLASGHVVVVQLGKLESDEVLRLFDYMMGAVLALEGEIVRPRATVVVLLPKDTELDEDQLEPDDEDDTDEDENYEDDEVYEDEDDDEAYESLEDDEYDEDEDGDYEEESDEDAE